MEERDERNEAASRVKLEAAQKLKAEREAERKHAAGKAKRERERKAKATQRAFEEKLVHDRRVAATKRLLEVARQAGKPIDVPKSPDSAAGSPESAVTGRQTGRRAPAAVDGSAAC